MSLTDEELSGQRAHYSAQTERFASAGFDRLGAPEFILDQAGALEGPALDIGTGKGITARALAGRGLDVESIDLNRDDQEVAAFLTDDPELGRRIRFTCTDAARLPATAGYFGCAVLVDVLHHLDDGGPVLRGAVSGWSSRKGSWSSQTSRPRASRWSRGCTRPRGSCILRAPVTVDWARGFLSGLGMTELQRFSGPPAQGGGVPHAGRRRVPSGE